MPKRPDKHPAKKELREMPAAKLAAYVASLRHELEWRQSGPVFKVRSKQLEVAQKLLAIRAGADLTGEE